MRAYAARNRARILEVAAERFTGAASTHHSRRSPPPRVPCIATLYRHFACREVLVQALVQDKLTPVTTYTESWPRPTSRSRRSSR